MIVSQAQADLYMCAFEIIIIDLPVDWLFTMVALRECIGIIMIIVIVYIARNFDFKAG